MPEFTPRTSFFVTEIKRRRESGHKTLISEKYSQYIYSVSIITCVFIAIHFCKSHQMTFYNLAGILDAIFFAHFFVLLFQISLSSDNLHFIRVKRKKSPMSNHLFLPYDTESDKTKPLDSVSAMIGLRGSNAEKMTSSLCNLIVGNSWLAVASNIIQTDNYYLNIGMMFAMFGLWLLMTWQLEYDLRNDFLHFVGVAMGIIGGFNCFMFQQQFSAFSVDLTICAVLNGVAFGAVRMIQFDKKNIHIQSLLLISFESFALFNCAVACCCYIYYLQDY